MGYGDGLVTNSGSNPLDMMRQFGMQDDPSKGFRRGASQNMPSLWESAPFDMTKAGNAIGGGTPNAVSATELEQNEKKSDRYGTQRDPERQSNTPKTFSLDSPPSDEQLANSPRTFTPPTPGQSGATVAPNQPTPGKYQTALRPDEESKFQQWVQSNKIPWQDTPTADYDMRGYWKAQQAGDPNAKQAGNQHFPDTYKTPYHQTFSNESIYATPDAPHWDGGKLIDNSGKVLANEGSGSQPQGQQQRTFPTPGGTPPSPQYPDVSGRLQKVNDQLDQMNQPLSVKRRIFNALATAAPVAIAGAFGGIKTAGEVAGGESTALQNMQAENDRQRQGLVSQAQNLTGVQERQAQAQSTDQFRAQQLGLMKRPEVLQTDDGPIQYDAKTATWGKISVDGQPVSSPDKTQRYKSPAEGYSAAVADAISRKVDPNSDPTVQQWKSAALGLQKNTDKPDTATELDQRYDRLRADQLQGKKLAPEDSAFLTSYHERKTMGPSAGANIRVEGATNLDATKRIRDKFDSSQDADTRLSRMEASYQKGLQGDQQAMLALLTDHIGMTLGLQKGARITKDILNEATASMPWLEKIGAAFDDRGYLSGVKLGPEQMKQMLSLGYEARNRQWNAAFNDADMYGVQPPPGAKKVFGKRNPDFRVFGQADSTVSGAQNNPNMNYTGNAPQFAEGQTRTNRKTGEVQVFKNGQWGPK